MIQIDDTLVSLDVIERYFLCDLSKCKGECCVEGDSGAPLEDSELAKLQKVISQAMGNMAGKTRADLAKELDDLAEELTEEGMPSEMSVEIQYTIKINFHSFI